MSAFDRNEMEEMAQRMGASLSNLKLPAPSLAPRTSKSSSGALASVAAQKVLEKAKIQSGASGSDDSGSVTTHDEESDIQGFPSVAEESSPFEDDGASTQDEEAVTSSDDDAIVIERKHEESLTFGLRDMVGDLQSTQRQPASGLVAAIDRWARGSMGLVDHQEPWNRRVNMSFGSHHINIFITWALLDFTPTHDMLENAGFDPEKIDDIFAYLYTLQQLRTRSITFNLDQEIEVPLSPVKARTSTEESDDSPTDTLLLMMLQGLTRVDGFPSSLAELKDSVADMETLRRELGL